MRITLTSAALTPTKIEYRILGPLEAAVDGRPAATGGRIQRAFLGVFLLRANEPLSPDRLVDAVWGEAPPSSALHAVSVYVAKLRKALGADAIAHTPAGYILRVAPGQLDLERFEALVWDARENLVAGEPGRACELLDEGLSLWRGPALVDTELEDFARADVARLEELRLGAATSRAEALLALARAGEALPELEALAAEHPHDERVAGLLILALYRAGRQGDALAHYQTTRLRLAADLGIEPSQSLQELERKILAQEPSLSLEPEEIEQVRSVVALPHRLDDLTAVAELTEPFALSRNPHEVILSWIAPPGSADKVSLAEAHTLLASLRTQLLERGGRARVAAFTTEDRAADILRLTGRSNVDLLLLGCELTDLDDDGRFGPELTRILGGAPCDVALWFERGEAARPGTAQSSFPSAPSSTTGLRSSSPAGSRRRPGGRWPCSGRPLIRAATGGMRAGCSPTRAC